VFNKGNVRIAGPGVSISRYARFSFNRSATNAMKEKDASRVLLLWDKDTKKIGIKPLPKGERDKRAYDVNSVRKDGTSFLHAKAFLEWMGYDYGENRSFELIWNTKEAVFEIAVSAEHIDKNKKHPTINEIKLQRKK
jgi:hypothetical protein